MAILFLVSVMREIVFLERNEWVAVQLKPWFDAPIEVEEADRILDLLLHLIIVSAIS